MKNFESYLAESKSPNTIKSYVSDLKKYFSFSNSTILTRSNIETYKQYLLNQNKSASTINRHLSSLSAYNLYLIQNKLMNEVIILPKDYIKVQKTKTNPNDLSKEEINKFIHEIKKYEPYRNYCIVMTLIGTGLRINECLSLRLNNIDLDNAEGYVVGKGNKMRRFDILPEIIPVLREYINNHRHKYLRASNSPYLFVSTRKDRLCTASINAIFNYYSDKITPHKLRHYFASEVYQQTNDIVLVKDQLGHSNINTTMIYTYQKIQDKKRKLAAVSI